MTKICMLMQSSLALALFYLSNLSMRCAFKPAAVRRSHYSLSLRAAMSSSTSLSDLAKPAASLLQQSASPQFVFVGGKGGVGKTTSSSAIALSFSESGYKTLVVSTDPAHSLGDALDVNLKSGNVVPISMVDNLWALEIDINRALGEFKDLVGTLNSDTMSKALGVPKDIIDSFGIDDLASVFTNPPPGIDEIVALTKIFAYADEAKNNLGVKFDRIVIDTAPTGHTIRLLQLPTFLGTLTGKLIKFRSKIYGALESFQGLFGGGESSSGKSGKDVLKVLDKLEALQEDISRVKTILKSRDRTQFVVVTIPTQLAVVESKRLISSLQKEGIEVSTIICNQVLNENADEKYLETRMRGQQQSLNALRSFLTKRLQQNKLYPIELTEVPYVDTEVTGVYGLKFFHNLAHKPVARTATNPIDSRKLTIFGGKGGVGKTTSASSWAVRLSDSGFKTLVVSSDPAHSLGDALQIPLTGTPQLIERNAEGGQLWAMEIDPSKALEEFKDIFGVTKTPPSKDGMSSMFPDIKGELTSLIYDVNDPPPGTDEIVAMAKVISFLDNGYRQPDGTIVKFDRIVLDTAPTGHTLRMLELPVFLQQLLQRFRKIRDKTNSIGSMFGMGDSPDDDSAPKDDRLLAFEQRMARLESLLHDSKETEFSVVTIPTDLAVAETQRLVESLDKSNVLMRRIIINQMINGADKLGGSDKVKGYIDKVRYGQALAMKDLQQIANSDSKNSISLIQVPYFDMEVRTVYGLKVVSNTIFPRGK